MRTPAILLATTMLAACGGGGPTTVGGAAAPASASQQQTAVHSFVAPTEPKTYQAIGGVSTFQYSTDDRNIRGQYSQLYQGDVSTARNGGITVTYNPRDAIFDLSVKQPNSGVSQVLRFQDPLHRTDFGGQREPQTGTPNLEGRGVQYLQAGGSSGPIVFDLTQSDFVPVGSDTGVRDIFTYFYQKPGTTTNFVTYAGYIRNNTAVARVVDVTVTPTLRYNQQNNILERGAFVFGERTGQGAVPRTGSGTFNGEMIASMVFNPLRDTDNSAPTYYQWIVGNSVTKVDFAANSFTLDLTGRVLAPQIDVFTSRVFALQANATFTAAGAGRVDLINAGGFLGQINSAQFVNPGVGGQRFDLQIGGSSIDGAFFGPAAQEVGGGFRIVGGVPDERIDILGAFTGKQ